MGAVLGSLIGVTSSSGNGGERPRGWAATVLSAAVPGELGLLPLEASCTHDASSCCHVLLGPGGPPPLSFEASVWARSFGSQGGGLSVSMAMPPTWMTLRSE